MGKHICAAWCRNRVACGGSDRLPARCPSPILRYKYSMEYALLFLRLGRTTAGVGALLVELKEEPKEAFVELKEALLIFPPDIYIYIYITYISLLLAPTHYIYIYTYIYIYIIYLSSNLSMCCRCCWHQCTLHIYIYIYIYILYLPHMSCCLRGRQTH